MEDLRKSVVPIIESVYESFTASEKIAADYFINYTQVDEDLSANTVAEKLHISQASLTRFSKKCGYTGYRQFRYEYTLNITEQPNIQRELTKKVIADYEEILNKTYSLINEEQLEQVIEMMIAAEKVYFYGRGSSGLVAEEMKSRFMRLGLYCDALTDPDMMKMNSALVDEKCLIIALSISGGSEGLITGLEQAHKNKAKTVLFTANSQKSMDDFCDEVVLVATSRNLSYGNRITPQFPLLVMVDIFYAYFLGSDFDSKGEIFSSTLSALDQKIIENREDEMDNE